MRYHALMTFALRNSALVVVLCAAFAIPAVVYGADPELEAQLRTVLSESAAQEGISAGELDALVQELGNKASAEGITAEEVSTASNAAPVVAPVQSGLPTTETSESLVLSGGYLTIFMVFGLLLIGMVLVAIWRKLEHADVLPQPPIGA